MSWVSYVLVALVIVASVALVIWREKVKRQSADFMTFLREVVSEVKKITWPGRDELWQRRMLVRVLAARELKSSYEMNVVGFAWWLLEPLSMTAVYYVLINNGEHLADTGKIGPAVAMWTPNLALLALGIYLLIRANRDTGVAEIQLRSSAVDSILPPSAASRVTARGGRYHRRARYPAGGPELG